MFDRTAFSTEYWQISVQILAPSLIGTMENLYQNGLRCVDGRSYRHLQSGHPQL